MYILFGYNQEEEAPAIWPRMHGTRDSASQLNDAGDGEGSRQPGRPAKVDWWCTGVLRTIRQGRSSDDRRQWQVEKIRS